MRAWTRAFQNCCFNGCPPEEADGPFRYWTPRKKYFLVIAVNKTDVPGTELPFAEVDGHLVVDALSVTCTIVVSEVGLCGSSRSTR